jgi:ECF transporter S component (folate family)
LQGRRFVFLKRSGKNVTKKLVFAALAVAMSIVIGIVCKAYFTLTPILRITFDMMPILLLGVMFGPVYSVMAAIGADVISALIAGFAPTPIITVGAAAIGLVAGLLPRIIIKRKSFVSIMLVSLSAQTVGSLFIKTYGLADLYSLPFWETLAVRLPVMLFIAFVEAYLVYILLKNKQLSKFADVREEKK